MQKSASMNDVTYSSQAESHSSRLLEHFDEQRHVLSASVVRQNPMRCRTRQLVRSSILLTAKSTAAAAAASAVRDLMLRSSSNIVSSRTHDD